MIKEKVKIENARPNCRICGYEINHIPEELNRERDWLCFQCWVNRDGAMGEELESRF